MPANPNVNAIKERLLKGYPKMFTSLFVSGLYAVQKTGTPMLQLHSYDYGGPFAAF